MAAQNIFTSANTSVLINDKFLHGIQAVAVEDKILPNGITGYTLITIKRYIIGDDNLINDMRTAGFSFKLTHNTTNAGYTSGVAHIDSFTMHLNRVDDGNDVLMEQTIVIKATSLRFVSDTRSNTNKVVEKEDLDNLMKLLDTKREVSNRIILPATVPSKKKRKVK